MHRLGAAMLDLVLIGIATGMSEGLFRFINFHPGTGYIDQIATGRAWQGKGVAVALLNAAKAACPGGLILKVNQDNPRAIRFYQREGFAISGEGVSETSGLKLWQMEWRASR